MSNAQRELTSAGGTREEGAIRGRERKGRESRGGECRGEECRGAESREEISSQHQKLRVWSRPSHSIPYIPKH